MLLGLSRASFWLAALAAALAWAAPGGYGMLFSGVAAVAAVTAVAAFGFARGSRPRATDRNALPFPLQPHQPLVLTESSLLDVAAMIVRACGEAASFESAMHAVARLLKGELGAREVKVYAVNGVDAQHAHLAELVEARPGFRAVAQIVRIDRSPVGQAAAEGRCIGTPPEVVAMPIVADIKALAVIELAGIETTIEAAALASLLDLSRRALAQVAQRHPGAAEVRAGPPPNSLHQAVRSALTPNPQICGRILLVEDNGGFREVGAPTLRSLGWEVHVAGSMLEGLYALCETQFDLVLLDTRVPGMGAVEALNFFRQGDGGGFRFVTPRHVPVIAVKSHVSVDDEERFLGLGFDGILGKPFRRTQLLAMLNQHVRVLSPLAADDSPGAGASVSSAPVQCAPAILDAAALSRLTELDPRGENQLLQRVFEAFETSATRLMPQMQQAQIAHDSYGIRHVVHTLKSSAASIGALELSKRCADIETMIRTEQMQDLEASIAAMSAELALVRAALQSFSAATR
ncbi:hypothetical protein BH11PSE8_BH11PSE8_38910 [soil metagenome]